METCTCTSLVVKNLSWKGYITPKESEIFSKRLLMNTSEIGLPQSSLIRTLSILNSMQRSRSFLKKRNSQHYQIQMKNMPVLISLEGFAALCVLLGGHCGCHAM